MADFDWGTISAAGSGAFIANFVAEWVRSLVRKSQSLESQRDTDLAEILKTISDLGQLSERYWTSSGSELGRDNNILTSHIVAKQHYLVELIAELFTGPIKWECDIALHRVMDSVTGGDFGDPERLSEPERLTSILTNNLKLAHTVKSCRRKIKRGFLA